MMLSLAAIGAYVLLVGVASFIEVPVGFELDALQLNALIRTGSAALAITAFLVVHGISLPTLLPLAAGFGIGLLAGAGSICYCFALNDLALSLVVSVANLSIVVTTALGLAILHVNIAPLKIASRQEKK